MNTAPVTQQPEETGIIVGRFQTPELHEGHRLLIETVRTRHARVIVYLGVRHGNPVRRDPMDFDTRKAMFEALYGNQITVLPLSDYKYDDDWCRQLDASIAEQTQNGPARLYGSRDSFLSCYTGAYPTELIYAADTGMSATSLRETCCQMPLPDAAFRAGVIYATGRRFPHVYPTVDALIRHPEGRVLLARKAGDRAWRFPGGFVDPTDAGLEAAVLRETGEECGALLLAAPRYIGSAKVNDWRYRGSEDGICTTFFLLEYQGGIPQAGDDIAQVGWFDEADIHPETLVEEHRVLWQLYLKSRLFTPVAN